MPSVDTDLGTVHNAKTPHFTNVHYACLICSAGPMFP